MPLTLPPPTRKKKSIPISRRDLERSLCQSSFYDFFLRFWPTVSSEKLVNNWHIQMLCHELQEMAERVFRREPKTHDLVANVPPGSTKSTIASVMFPAWCWARQPDFRLINGCYALDLALFLAKQCRIVVSSEKYQELFPEVVLVSEAEGMMMTSKNGQRIACAVGGRITGMHAHFITIDDPLNPKEALSTPGLTTATHWFEHTIPHRMVRKDMTPIALFMQRLAEADPSQWMISQGIKPDAIPVRHLCLPANNTEFGRFVRPRSWRKFYTKEGLLDPNRFSWRVLKAEASRSEFVYAGQFGQTPVPLGGGMFKVDMMGTPTLLIPTHWRSVVRYWDKAGTGSGRGTFTVGVKMGRALDGTFWILDVIKGQWEAGMRETVIRNTARADGRRVQIGVEQEPGSGGKDSAVATVKNLAGFIVRKDKVTTNKADRADAFATQVNLGNVKLAMAEWNDALIDEMRFFPVGRFKDQCDAASGAFRLITGKIRAGGL